MYGLLYINYIHDLLLQTKKSSVSFFYIFDIFFFPVDKKD